MPAKREQWFVTVRRQLKAEHGFGWSIRDHRGTVQLTRRFEDDSRSSAYLPLPWRKDSGTPILNWVTAIRDLMEQQNLSLKKAVEQYGNSLADPKQAAATVGSGSKAWKAALEAFMATKSGCRPNTIKWTSSRLHKLLQTVGTAPKPRNAEAALRAYAAQHFYDADGNAVVAAGGTGRARALRYMQHINSVSQELGEVTYKLSHAKATWKGGRTYKTKDFAACVEMLCDQGYGEVVEDTSSLTYRSLRPMPGDSTNSKKQPVCQLESTAAQSVSKKGRF